MDRHYLVKMAYNIPLLFLTEEDNISQAGYFSLQMIFQYFNDYFFCDTCSIYMAGGGV